MSKASARVNSKPSHLCIRLSRSEADLCIVTTLACGPVTRATSCCLLLNFMDGTIFSSEDFFAPPQVCWAGDRAVANCTRYTQASYYKANQTHAVLSPMGNLRHTPTKLVLIRIKSWEIQALSGIRMR